MINQVGTEQLDDAIDRFEESWTPRSPQEIRLLLEEFGLADDCAALTELIRIDIELRYTRDLSVRLDDYFAEFETLLAEPYCVAQIAFEDFRSRTAFGHPLSVTRWRSLPGVSSERWYQQIANPPDTIELRQPRMPANFRPQLIVDEEVELALESIGFRLIQPIGQGAFSNVYLATQNDLANRHVVLKVVEKTLAEPQHMATLQHTNIVPIYSFHRVQSRSVICMPYAGVVTLSDFLASERKAASRGGPSLVTTVLNRVSDTVIAQAEDASGDLPPRFDWVPAAVDGVVLKPLEHLNRLDSNELALWMFERLAAALAHSHARGVLHGDLKPANVLIRNDGEPALLDFNLSHSLDCQQIKHIGGTLPYMAPESYRGLMGQLVAPDRASDIFGLGVMLFEFVTGRLPFPSPRSSAAIDLEPALRLREQDPDWKIDDCVTPGLKSIINRSLAFEPADRYASAEQFREDLQREGDNRPLLIADESARSQANKWVRRHPRVVSGTTVAMLLLALLIPIGMFAKASHDQSKHMAAMATIDSFADQSTQALSLSASDPRRLAKSQVQAAIKPLEDFGLLDRSRQEELASQLSSDDARAKFQNLVLRHVLHVTFTEIGNLRVRNELPIDESKLGTVDRLIAAAERLHGETPSRALLYARAERAELVGDGDAPKLLAEAKDLPIKSDTEMYLEAIRLMANQRYFEARDLLTVLADRGTIPSALRWTSLGRAQFYASDYELAKLSFTKSLEHAPESSRLLYLRGRCFYRLKQIKQAKQDFTDAIKYEPTFSSALATRGLCLQSQRRHEEAIDDFNEALKHHPGDVHVLILRSRALRNVGRDEEADRDYKAALSATNLTLAGLTTRANERSDRGDLQGALDDLQQAYAMDRGDPYLLLSMAVVLANMDRIPEAIDALDRYVDAKPSETSRIDRAVLLARVGKVDAAIEDLKAAVKPPNVSKVQYQAACVHALLMERGKGSRALALLFLSKALLAGYGIDDVLTDEDLDSLRDDEDFKALLRTVELSKGARRGLVSSPTASASRHRDDPEPSPKTSL
jgi:serine/threonine protein kinase/tetratricopeptide (TPR) repeat protein